MVKSSELCAVTKSQELKQHFWHTFVSTNFVHNHWLGQVTDGPHSDTWAPFPESFWTWRQHGSAEHARFQRARAYTPLFFSTHSLFFGGQVMTYLRAVLKGSPWAGSTRGAAPGLTWNWCCCVILWEQAQFQMHLFLEVNLLEIVFEMPWFTFSRYLINTGKETFLYKKAML